MTGAYRFLLLFYIVKYDDTVMTKVCIVIPWRTKLSYQIFLNDIVDGICSFLIIGAKCDINAIDSVICIKLHKEAMHHRVGILASDVNILIFSKTIWVWCLILMAELPIGHI